MPLLLLVLPLPFPPGHDEEARAPTAIQVLLIMSIPLALLPELAPTLLLRFLLPRLNYLAEEEGEEAEGGD